MKRVSIVMKYTGYVPEDTSLGELREYAEGRIDDFFRYYDENNDENMILTAMMWRLQTRD